MTIPTFEAIVADYRKLGYSPEEALRRARLQTGGLFEEIQTPATDSPRPSSRTNGERPAALERHRIVLSQLAKSRHRLRDGMKSVVPGDAYAYDFSRLSAREDQAWHWTLMRAALVALHTVSPKAPVIVGYELLRGLVRVFLCGKAFRVTDRAHAVLRRVPGYIESGSGVVSVEALRPLAAWAPPTKLVALWPLPIDGRPGPYAIDAGNMLLFRSYPEADYEEGLDLDLAGPDYMRVPVVRESTLEPEGIIFENRWADLIESEDNAEAVDQPPVAAPQNGGLASPPASRLECRAEDFVSALRLLKASAKGGSSLKISFMHGELVFTRGATTVRVPATGTWSGAVTVSVQMIRDLLKAQKALPDALVIAANASRLSISHYSTPCW